MVEISFEINGRKVSPNQIGDALTKAVLGKVQEHIQKTVGSTRCPEHGSTTKIKCKGRSADQLSFDVSGCCQKLIDNVKEKLK
jgi:hypothetical protein